MRLAFEPTPDHPSVHRYARCSVAGRRRSIWRCSRRRKKRFCAGSSGSNTACLSRTLSAGYSVASTQTSSAPRFSASCAGFPGANSGCRRHRWQGPAAGPSINQASGKSPLHMVSALGLRAAPRAGADRHRCEVERDHRGAQIGLATPPPQGTIVTTDALNCQRAIAAQIVDQGDDDVLALKQNQGTLYNDAILFLDDPASNVTTARHRPWPRARHLQGCARLQKSPRLGCLGRRSAL